MTVCRINPRALSLLGALLALACGGQLLGAQTALGKPRSASSTNDAILALGILIQVMNNLADKVQRHELSSLHIEDLVFGESVVMLAEQAPHVDVAIRRDFADQVRELARLTQRLHVAGDMQSQRTAEVRLKLVLPSYRKIKESFPPSIQAAAQTAANLFACPAHRQVRGGPEDACPLCGQSLKRVRLLPPFRGLADPAKQSIKAAVRTDHPLRPGTPVHATLELKRPDGTPVYPTDLRLSHTERILLSIWWAFTRTPRPCSTFIRREPYEGVGPGRSGPGIRALLPQAGLRPVIRPNSMERANPLPPVRRGGRPLR